MTAADRDELFRLFGGLSQETLTADEHRRLQEILRGSAEARRLWFLHCDLERGLARWSAARRATAASASRALTIVPHPGGTPTRQSRPVAWSWGLGMAAGLVALAIAGSAFLLPRALARPAALTRWALAVNSGALDRCYQVSAASLDPAAPPGGEPPPAAAGLPTATRGWRETRLWTRGDRFWNECRVGEQTAAWGRDEQGRVWFTVAPGVGAQFDPDELPERLVQICELRSLQPESLLRSLLADFDLRREPDADGNGYVVHAELKPGRQHPRYRSARLEIDRASGVLRRVETERVFPGGRPPVRVSFTLLETATREDASYTLAGHLSGQAVIHDRESARGERARSLRKFLGLLRGQTQDQPPSTTTH